MTVVRLDVLSFLPWWMWTEERTDGVQVIFERRKKQMFTKCPEEGRRNDHHSGCYHQIFIADYVSKQPPALLCIRSGTDRCSSPPYPSKESVWRSFAFEIHGICTSERATSMSITRLSHCHQSEGRSLPFHVRSFVRCHHHHRFDQFTGSVFPSRVTSMLFCSD